MNIQVDMSQNDNESVIDISLNVLNSSTTQSWSAYLYNSSLCWLSSADNTILNISTDTYYITYDGVKNLYFGVSSDEDTPNTIYNLEIYDIYYNIWTIQYNKPLNDFYDFVISGYPYALSTSIDDKTDFFKYITFFFKGTLTNTFADVSNSQPNTLSFVSDVDLDVGGAIAYAYTTGKLSSVSWLYYNITKNEIDNDEYDYSFNLTSSIDNINCIVFPIQNSDNVIKKDNYIRMLNIDINNSSDNNIDSYSCFLTIK